MLGLEKKIPGFIVHQKSIVGTTIFTGVFALAFINFYAPFGVDQWFHLNRLQLFFYSSLVILTGMLVIVLSRIVLTRYKKKHVVSYLDYSIWIFAEMVSMAAFYSLFIKYALNDSREYTEIMKVTIKNTALVLLIPYTVLWLYYAYQEKNIQLEKLARQSVPNGKIESMVSFFDEKGKHKLTLQTDDLLYIEASDNYVSVYYQQGDKLNKYLIRNTLKTLEEELKGYNVLRVHRSFLLNAKRVKVLKREKEGLMVVLDAPKEVILPVSKTYISSVISSFSNETL